MNKKKYLILYLLMFEAKDTTIMILHTRYQNFIPYKFVKFK